MVSQLGSNYLGTLFAPRRDRLQSNEMAQWLTFLEAFGKPVVWLDGHGISDMGWKGMRKKLFDVISLKKDLCMQL